MQILHRLSKLVALSIVGIACATLQASAAVKSGTAVVKAIKGAASYADELGLDHPLAVGSVVKEGQTIRTSTGSSVDLFLAENGPGVALEGNSVLVLEKLTSQQSVLGTLIDTRLDLRQGKLYGTVDKLLPGSHYEVKMPTGIATVRGTEFFIDAQTGTVYVTSGTVNVTVTLKGDVDRTRTIAVKAGQELVIPNTLKNPGAFNQLAPTPLPPGLNQTTLRRLAQLHLLTQYTSGRNVSSVSETFKTGKDKGATVDIDKPPKSIVVSQ
jgi:hypothetical protein